MIGAALHAAAELVALTLFCGTMLILAMVVVYGC